MKNVKINIKINKNTLFTAFFAVILSIFISISGAQAKEINLENTVILTNKARVESDLGELLINPVLNKVASRKAQHMVKYHYFSHTSPEGIDPWYWFKKEGYDYKYAGENLAINYKTAEEQHVAWMKSPTHRKNILNPRYKEIGIATASGYINNKPASVTVQAFGSPQKPIATTSALNNDSILAQRSPSIPYVLGEQINYPIQTQYLTQANAPKDKTQKTSFSLNNNLLNVIKKQSHNILWVIILILCIVIIRDIVLKSIAPPIVRHHSMTNLILLMMLWSVFIGM